MFCSNFKMNETFYPANCLHKPAYLPTANGQTSLLARWQTIHDVIEIISVTCSYFSSIMGAEPITCPIIGLPTALQDEVSSHLGAENFVFSILGDDNEDLPSKN